MAHDSNRYVGLHAADRLDQLRKAQRREHAIRAGRRAIQRPIGRIDALHGYPPGRPVVEAALPEIGQARTAVRERTAAPIVLLVQENLVAVFLEFLGCRPIAPPEMNDR